MPNYFVCTYGNFDGRNDLLDRSEKEKCYFLHENVHYPSAIKEIKQGDIVLLKDNAFIIAWGEAENLSGTDSPITHTGTNGWKHVIKVKNWNKGVSSVHSYGLQWKTLIGGKMSLVKKVTPRWALEKLSAMKQIDTLPFVKQDLFELSLDDIASWYYNDINSDKGILATVPTLQRGLVWSAQQNELFWDSVMRKIPVGAILLCPTILSQNKGNMPSTHHILDGQQRCNAIAKGFDCNPFTQDDAIVWLDLDPDKEKLKGTSRRYLVRISTVSHPWGYKITDATGRSACLETGTIRDALKNINSENSKRPIPAQMYPAEANLPIPLGFLLHSFMRSETEDEFWGKAREYINAIPFDNLKSRLRDFVDNNSEQKKHIYTGIKNAMFYKIVAMNAPETIVTEDTEDTESTIEHLFQRINRQGTRLDGEELVYSTIKSYWPNIAEKLDECANGRMPASRLLVLAIRAALSEDELKGNISVNHIRKLIKNDDEQKKIESFLDSSLKLACKKIDDWLRYSDDNPIGLPPVLYTTIAHSAPEIYLLLLIFAKQNCKFEPKFVISLVLLLFFYDFRKRNSRRESIIRDLYTQCIKENNFTEEIITKKIQTMLTQPEKFIFPVNLAEAIQLNDEFDITQQEIYEADWWQCFERFRCNKDLLLYAQTKYLCDTFPDFDPARKDLWQEQNRPWDYDHIVAQNVVAGWKNPKNNGWLWCIGNFAAIPLENNRSKSDKPDFKYYDEHKDGLLVSGWSNLLSELKSEKQIEFREAVLERFFLIYNKLHEQICCFLPDANNTEKLSDSNS